MMNDLQQRMFLPQVEPKVEEIGELKIVEAPPPETVVDYWCKMQKLKLNKFKDTELRDELMDHITHLTNRALRGKWQPDYSNGNVRPVVNIKSSPSTKAKASSAAASVAPETVHVIPDGQNNQEMATASLQQNIQPMNVGSRPTFNMPPAPMQYMNMGASSCRMIAPNQAAFNTTQQQGQSYMGPGPWGQTSPGTTAVYCTNYNRYVTSPNRAGATGGNVNNVRPASPQGFGGDVNMAKEMTYTTLN